MGGWLLVHERLLRSGDGPAGVAGDGGDGDGARKHGRQDVDVFG